MEEDQGCEMPKVDGSRCGRAVCDFELNACRLHVETARKQREFARRAEVEGIERDRQVIPPLAHTYASAFLER